MVARTPIRDPERDLSSAFDSARRALDDVVARASPGLAAPVDEARRLAAAAEELQAAQRRLETAVLALRLAEAELSAAQDAWGQNLAGLRSLLEGRRGPAARGRGGGDRERGGDRSPGGGTQGRTGQPGQRRRPGQPRNLDQAGRPGKPGKPLAIVTFGRFEVRCGGAPVRLCSSRSGQAILRYLATHPRHRESSDALIELLWPEDPPKAARHKLHCAFSALRTSLHAGASADQAPYVGYADGFYELTPDIGTTVDVDALFRAYRAGQRLPADEAARQYESACSMAAGMFLPDDAYADWAIARREAVAGALRSMQHMLAAHHLASGRIDEARSWCRRLLGDNRTDEAAYRLLMQAEVAAGHRGEALRQYQACVRALRDDLGIEPMAETTDLFEAIVRGSAG